jgi:hypothetical protein
MKRWLITYFLRAPGLEHLDLFSALKRAGATKIMPSHWLLESERTAADLRDQFSTFLSVSDQLLVAELGADMAFWGTNAS